MRFLSALGRGWVSFWHSRVPWTFLLCGVFCFLVTSMMLEYRYVTVYDFEKTGITHFKTRSSDRETLLAEAGVEVGEFDEVVFSGPARRMEITIERAYPVYVEADGITSRVFVTDATVDEALALCGVALGTDDIVDLAYDRPLAEGETVSVTRVHYEDDHYTEEIPYDTEYRLTSLLRTGARRTLTRGQPGERTIFLRDKYIDGQLVASFRQNELVTVEPQATVGLEGQTGLAISPYEPFAGVETDANGKPTNAVEIRTNMRTVSYYVGSTCASGLPARVGHIGVNPKVFPYGTRLYIESADGKFVYGYCIAADCGPGTLNNTIDFDLFFDTYYECGLLGRRNDIVVYILPDE